MSRANNRNVECFTDYEGLDPRTAAAIQKKIIKEGKRNVATRLLRAKNDKDKIAAWKQDLLRVLQVFNVGSFVAVQHLFT